MYFMSALCKGDWETASHYTLNFTLFEAVTQLAAPSRQCHVDFDLFSSVKEYEQLHYVYKQTILFVYFCPSAEYMTALVLSRRPFICHNFTFNLRVCERERKHGGRWVCWRLQKLLQIAFRGRSWGNRAHTAELKIMAVCSCETSGLCKHDWLICVYENVDKTIK